jgi:hypothetical protein
MRNLNCAELLMLLNYHFFGACLYIVNQIFTYVFVTGSGLGIQYSRRIL